MHFARTADMASFFSLRCSATPFSVFSRESSSRCGIVLRPRCHTKIPTRPPGAASLVDRSSEGRARKPTDNDDGRRRAATDDDARRRTTTDDDGGRLRATTTQDDARRRTTTDDDGRQRTTTDGDGRRRTTTGVRPESTSSRELLVLARGHLFMACRPSAFSARLPLELRSARSDLVKAREDNNGRRRATTEGDGGRRTTTTDDDGRP